MNKAFGNDKHDNTFAHEDIIGEDNIELDDNFEVAKVTGGDGA